MKWYQVETHLRRVRRIAGVRGNKSDASEMRPYLK